ncbi:MAG TPA: BON domain-containing protein [Chloroflexota bacterium]|nr:BON domain-containing protein [Chloroflexota bacterium]
MNSNDQSYEARENQWDEWQPRGDEEPSGHSPVELDVSDELTPFPGAVGTVDSLDAVRDAEPYVPPIDPPVLPGGEEAIHVATGFGLSPAQEAAYDPPPRGDEDIREQAILALRQDSLTSQYALDVDVRDGIVVLTGRVDSPEDADHATWMLGELPGVVDVIDNTVLEPTGT